MNEGSANPKTCRKIGEVARQLGTTTRTLRFYEEQGLLEPNRTEKGTRLYTDDDIERFRAIFRLAELGLPLRTIGMLTRARPESVTGDEFGRKVKRLLERLREEVEEKLNECQLVLKDVEETERRIANCFGCDRPPGPDGCTDCPITEGASNSGLLHLIWDRKQVRMNH